MYRAVTIPHAMPLNAMLTKKASCATMSVSFQSFQIDGVYEAAFACSRSQIVDSGASCGCEGNGRRSSRSYRSRSTPGLSGVITNCAT